MLLLPCSLKPQASTLSLVKLKEAQSAVRKPKSEHTEGVQVVLGKRKDESSACNWEDRSCICSCAKRKAEVYTREVDAWQNNKANARARKGCRKTKAFSPLYQGGIFRDTEGITQHKTVSL